MNVQYSSTYANIHVKKTYLQLSNRIILVKPKIMILTG